MKQPTTELFWEIPRSRSQICSVLNATNSQFPQFKKKEAQQRILPRSPKSAITQKGKHFLKENSHTKSYLNDVK